MTGGTARREEAESKECTGFHFLVQAAGRGAFSPSLLLPPPRGEKGLAEVRQSQAGLFVKACAVVGWGGLLTLQLTRRARVSVLLVFLLLSWP